MKQIVVAIFFTLTLTANAQDQKPKVKQIVEASCGQCQFGMKGHGCDLAVKIDGKPYFVEGTHLDDHGDAHAADGFCTKVRQAEVVGELKNNRFVVSEFKLLPEVPKKNNKR